MNLPPCPAGNFSTNMNKILPYATGDASLCTKVEYPCLGSDVVLRVSDPVRLQPPWITPLWTILNSRSRIRNETIISVRVEGPTRRCHSLDTSYCGCNQGFHAWIQEPVAMAPAFARENSLARRAYSLFSASKMACRSLSIGLRAYIITWLHADLCKLQQVVMSIGWNPHWL